MAKSAGKQTTRARDRRAQTQSAREKVAAQRAQARRAEVRRRVVITGASIAAVLAIVIALVLVKATSSSSPSPPPPAAAQANAAVAGQVTSVPATAFDAVGAGTADGLKRTSGQPLLTQDGKPELLYVGGEFCPFCAAERWALAAALSRFGTLSGLQFIHSSPTDVYPSTPTLSFAKASYTSKYLAFAGVEWYGQAEDPSTPLGHVYLQHPTAQQTALFNKYGGGAIPFVDVGNQYLVPQAQYLPSALAGLSWSQVAAAMHDPSSPVAKDIDGAANMITAAICKLTHGQPGGVCSSAGVKAAGGSI
ncbi:MAG TPA: DUF929 family protein [Streptosporangiaceae bacterium]|jgi:hypothetical protein|nr:DUF929 family protein [Streptosporangiaceae bacterium]